MYKAKPVPKRNLDSNSLAAVTGGEHILGGIHLFDDFLHRVQHVLDQIRPLLPRP